MPWSQAPLFWHAVSCYAKSGGTTMPSAEQTSPINWMQLYIQGCAQGDLFACFTQLFNCLSRKKKLEINYIFEHWQLCIKHPDKILSYATKNLETSVLLP